MDRSTWLVTALAFAVGLLLASVIWLPFYNSIDRQAERQAQEMTAQVTAMSDSLSVNTERVKGMIETVSEVIQINRKLFHEGASFCSDQPKPNSRADRYCDWLRREAQKYHSLLKEQGKK